MSHEPSNYELLQKISHVADMGERIEKQVIKTNGRVSSLESWRWFITGGLAIISLMVIPVLFIMIKAYI